MRNTMVFAACLTLLAGALGQGVERMDEALAQPGPTAAPSHTATQSEPTETPDGTATPRTTTAPSVTPTDPLETPSSSVTPGGTDSPTPGGTDSPTPDATAPPTSQLETPIVDPEPGPGKVFLPRVVRGEDAALPPPVVAGDRGWVASLTQRGREACAPATHVLLEKPEGTIDNRAIAVLENRMQELELDFYIGEFVEASGIESMSAEACRQTTSRHIGVVLIRRVPRPPGE